MSWLFVTRKPDGKQGYGGGHQEKPEEAFFIGPIGVFQCDLSPLSSCAIMESCVMPVLLYGCENWGFNEAAIISHLETFLSGLAKRNLKLPKWASNMAANIVLDYRESQGSCAEVDLL